MCVYVPIGLTINLQVGQPVAGHVTNLTIHVFYAFQVFGKGLLFTELYRLYILRFHFVNYSFHVRLAPCGSLFN